MTPPVPPLERVRELIGVLSRVMEISSRDTMDDLASILQDYLRRVEAERWQPIETAPHDVTITIYCPGGTYHSGFSYPEAVGPCRWREGDGLNPPGWYGVGNPRCHPTHWRPLQSMEPPPPEASSTALEGEK